ncbi:unnamed protein product [Nesidiocoris tenuis]|uniref:Uncharacterized protein n=1 Tax=Nesidiocoris tenuis TaxID=355587 RepID=A0A6H5G0N4_9HEMI|nr:unnamed protein product [Nesidiocoris tenuis]
MKSTCPSIEAHVRNAHLGPRNEREGDEDMEGDDHEEEFYYTEVEVGFTSPPPTLSHRDMARPPHEDPEYQRALAAATPVSIPKTASFSWPVSAAVSPVSIRKVRYLLTVHVAVYRTGGQKIGTGVFLCWNISSKSDEIFFKKSGSFKLLKKKFRIPQV